MLDRPGYLKPITSRYQWLDLVYASDLSMESKLVATVVSSTCQWTPRHIMQLSAISDYSISRILNNPQHSSTEVREILEQLFDNGWLFDTGMTIGAKRVFGLTFSLQPKEMRK